MMANLYAPRLRILAAALLFSTGGAAIKSCALTGWQVASFRSLIAAATLLVILPSVRRRPSYGTLVVGLFYAGMMVSYVSANKATTAASAIFLQGTAPLYILALAPFLLGERARWRDLTVMVGMATGLAILLFWGPAASATAPAPVQGNILGAVAGFCWAMTVMGLRWLEQRRPGNEGALAVVVGNAIAGLVCLPMALPVVAAEPSDFLWVAYLGMFQIGAAYVFLTSAMGSVPALDASLLLLAEPIFNPVWAALVLDEVPGRWTLVGASLILAMTVLKSYWDATQENTDV
jgi:DME family drug/metabolite transporter